MKKLFFFLPFLIAGCSQTSVDVEPTILTFNQSDLNNQQASEAYNSLIDSATISSEALRELSNLANGEASLDMSIDDYDEYLFQSNYVPAGMERDADIKWNGDFYPVVLTMADISGYKVAPPTNIPIGDFLVNIDTSLSSQRYSVMDVIRLINDDHKERLELVIHEELRVIEIIYL